MKNIIKFLLIVAVAASAQAIDIVGSSTVYPFSTVAAERFSQITGAKAPIVESTGSGGGLKLFCAGSGGETPSIANASRRIKKSEQTLCDNNGVADVIEVKIGYDGIVIARSRAAAESFPMTRRELFMALAREVPDANGVLSANPNETWQDVNASLPAIPIRVYGPPPTSGTRDAFAELAMEKGCDSFPELKAPAKPDKKRRQAVCHSIREDGAYIESGENDNLIIQKLVASPDALGVFGYSFLEENRDKVSGAVVDGVAPAFEAIADGSYPISRPLFFYVKKAHYGEVEGLQEFVEFFVQEEVMGEDGFLAERGLIPLPPAEYAKTAAAVKSRSNMERL